MIRPCHCNKDTCRLCYLFHNDERYKRLWSEPEPKINAYLINLRRRQDRLVSAVNEFKKTSIKPIRVEAVDGLETPMPETWKKQGMGTWGCNRSHVEVLRDTGDEPIMVFEDDVTFVKDFDAMFAKFMTIVASDWDAIFLGGQHMPDGVPLKVNDGVLKCINVHRTHAYMIRGEYKKFMLNVWETQVGHIDHRWGENQKDWKVYAPEKWLCGQSASKSDINNRVRGERWWAPTRVQSGGCAGCGRRR